MVTAVCLVSAILLLAVHEFLVARTRAHPTRGDIARRLVLIAVLTFAVGVGFRTELSASIGKALNSFFDEPRPFEPTGNTFLYRTLQTQQPERPFPVDGGLAEIKSWQEDRIDSLRIRSEFGPASQEFVEYRVLETQDVGDVRRTLIAFTSFDGTSIPAYVHEPKEKTNRGGVLVIAGHGSGIRALSGIGPADYQHAAALEMARRGFVTLAPELRGFGLLTPDGAAVHTTVAQAALAAGTFYKAVVARDLALALTVLQHWNGVDGSRLAVAGASLGGELAVLLGVLDSRPRVIISHSYGGLTGPEPIGSMRDDTQETPHGCHTIPGINRIVHREDWFRLIAPRALQVVRGADDLGRRADVSAFGTAIAQPFNQFGASDRLQFSVQPGGHEFFLEPAVQFLVKWL